MQSGKHLMEIYTLPFIKYPSNTIFHKIFNFCSPVSSYFSSLPFSFLSLILLITLQEVEGLFFIFSLVYHILSSFVLACPQDFTIFYVPGQNSFPKLSF